MTMSTDRVRFFLPKKYFQYNKSTNGMLKSTCVDVLNSAFKMSCQESREIMDAHRDGFYILCRPSQFARFIVYRNDAGECINGIRDLHPEIIDPDHFNKAVAKVAGASLREVTRVLEAFKTCGADISYGCPALVDIDVATRHHRRG